MITRPRHFTQPFRKHKTQLAKIPMLAPYLPPRTNHMTDYQSARVRSDHRRHSLPSASVRVPARRAVGSPPIPRRGRVAVEPEASRTVNSHARPCFTWPCRRRKPNPTPSSPRRNQPTTTTAAERSHAGEQWRSVADNQDGAGGPICLLIATIDGSRH
jgi:hypothetical protein